MTEQTKTLAALAVGDTILSPTGNGDVYRVHAVHTWQPLTRLPRVDAVVSVVSLTTCAGDALRGPASQEVTLATAEQVTAAVEEYVRRRAVADLQALAAFIERYQLRIADIFDAPFVSMRLEAGEVDRVAEALGVGMAEYGPGARRAVWPGPDSGGVVTAEFVGVPAPAHWYAAGSAGGPGACSAVCACGATVAGFDTVGEAAAVLAQHIADPDGTGEPTPAIAPEVAAAEPGGDADQLLAEVLADFTPGAHTITFDHLPLRPVTVFAWSLDDLEQKIRDHVAQNYGSTTVGVDLASMTVWIRGVDGLLDQAALVGPGGGCPVHTEPRPNECAPCREAAEPTAAQAGE